MWEIAVGDSCVGDIAVWEIAVGDSMSDSLKYPLRTGIPEAAGHGVGGDAHFRPCNRSRMYPRARVSRTMLWGAAPADARAAVRKCRVTCQG